MSAILMVHGYNFDVGCKRRGSEGPAEREGSLALRLVSGAVRVVAVAVVMFLAIIYLKFGYFVIFLLPLGAVTAVLLTRAQGIRQSGLRWPLSRLTVRHTLLYGLRRFGTAWSPHSRAAA
jgi:hypothetical protein